MAPGPPQPDSFRPDNFRKSPHFRITVQNATNASCPTGQHGRRRIRHSIGELRCTLDAQPLTLHLAYDFANAGSDPAPGQLSILSPRLTGNAEGLPTSAFEQD